MVVVRQYEMAFDVFQDLRQALMVFALGGPLIIYTRILPLTFEGICISILVFTKTDDVIHG